MNRKRAWGRGRGGSDPPPGNLGVLRVAQTPIGGLFLQPRCFHAPEKRGGCDSESFGELGDVFKLWGLLPQFEAFHLALRHAGPFG